MKLRSLVKFSTDFVRNPAAARDLVRWFSLYRRRNEEDPLARGIPWLTFPAIRFLEDHLRSYDRVFEWGSGGSTLFFARRCAEVVSVEHDRAFHDRVRQRLAETKRVNATLLLREPASQGRCASRHGDYRGSFFDDYVDAIDQYPERSFDVISIDGRQRNACARAAISRLRRGGLVVLDNSDRDYYAKGIEALRAAGLRQRCLPGFTPFASHQSETSVFTWGNRAR